jgi:hypothetical protein
MALKSNNTLETTSVAISVETSTSTLSLILHLDSVGTCSDICLGTVETYTFVLPTIGIPRGYQSYLLRTTSPLEQNLELGVLIIVAMLNTSHGGYGDDTMVATAST